MKPSISELLARARALPYRFPPGTARVQLDEHIDPAVAEMASAVTPLCESSLESLLGDFLKLKQCRGTASEQKLYKSMTASQLFTRLLVRRPLGFWGTGDRHVLSTRCDEKGKLLSDKWGGFETIGSDAEVWPLVLDRYLSYDEMALAALVSVAVPTRFISSGDRTLLNLEDQAAWENGEAGCCAIGAEGSFVHEGIIVGCVGARLVKPGYMEAAYLLIGPDRTIEAAEKLQHWAHFYGETSLPTYDDARNTSTGRFHLLSEPCCGQCGSEGTWLVEGYVWCMACMESYYGSQAWPGEQLEPKYLDTKLYKLRMQRSISPFLAFADKHGVTSASGAHVRVKGLGLGVWQVDPVQELLMKQVYQELLATNAYLGISVLEFSYFSLEGLPQHDRIKIIASKAAFADPIEPGRALVTMYAWDGNAYPGNEWWAGNKAMTDDSAAASCSLIASLQHPEINHERLCAQAAQVLDADLKELRPFAA